MKKISECLNEHIKTDPNSILIKELKDIIKELPEMRWNISEDSGYFGDEWDNWEHMEEDDRYEYFSKMFSTIKKLKDKIKNL